MNRWHLELVLERMEQRNQRLKPRFEWSLIPIGMLLSVLPTTLTATYQDGFGLKAAEWSAVAHIEIVITLVVALLLFGWWFIDLVRTPPSKSAADICHEIIQEIEDDNERAAAKEAERSRARQGGFGVATPPPPA